MRTGLACALGFIMALAGCSKSGGPQSKEAVQNAIQQYLQKQSKLVVNNMNMDVQDVKFNGDRAEAEVKFRSKQSPDLAVGVHYTLRRAGDQWEVVSSSATSMGGNPHGAAGPPPASRPAEPTPQPSH